jgi:hypothetical protein
MTTQEIQPLLTQALPIHVLPIQALPQALSQALPQAPPQALPQALQFQAMPTQVPIMADYAKGVKEVPCDGTQENFYLWTTQLLGFAETNNCEQAFLGKLTFPASTDVLDPGR